MKKYYLTLLLGAFILTCLSSVGWAETEKDVVAPEEQPRSQEVVPEKAIVPLDASVTDHTVTVAGKKLNYRARAELMPVFDDKGDEMGRVFYVAYSRTKVSGKDRPVTFAFNGGPGSSSLFLHMGAFGPKVVKSSPDGIGLPRPPYVVQDNEDTILEDTDLVFVDPIGTGFSRGFDPDSSESFWGVSEDVASVAQFIRMYLTREGRWGSPIYIAGESYGGIRATGLASALMDMGIMPSGIILVAPVASYGDLVPDSSNDRPYIHALPAMAAAAWYHGKLPEDLQSLPLEKVLYNARDWASGTYLKALWDGNGLSEEEFEAVLEGLNRYTSLPERDIKSLNLRVPPAVFLSGLLQDDRLMISRYDTRLTGPGGWYDYGEDPMFTLVGAPYYTAFMSYLRDELDFSTDREYLSGNDEALYRWNFQSGSEAFVGYPNTVDLLASAMRRCDFLKVFVAMGAYDMTCTADSILYTLGRLDVPVERLKENVTVKTYDGGHMMYTNPSAKAALKSDLDRFFGGR